MKAVMVFAWDLDEDADAEAWERVGDLVKSRVTPPPDRLYLAVEGAAEAVLTHFEPPLEERCCSQEYRWRTWLHPAHIWSVTDRSDPNDPDPPVTRYRCWGQFTPVTTQPS